MRKLFLFGILNFAACFMYAQTTQNFVAKFSTTPPTVINSNIFDNGNIGIGTTSPSYKFQVNTSIYGWTSSIQNQGCNLYFAHGGNGTDGYGMHIKVNNNRADRYALQIINGTSNNIFHITNYGNVGINNSNPGVLLDVKLPSTAVNGTTIASFHAFSNGHVFVSPKLSVSGYSSLSANGDQGIFWSDESNGALNVNGGFVIAPWANNTAGIRISKEGNVGIGVSVAGAKLDVAGQVKITGGSPGSGKILTSDGTGLASWEFPVTNGTAWQLNGNTGTGNFLGTTDLTWLIFKTNGIERMIINENGSVGIGTETIPTGYKLAVGGKIIAEEITVALQPWPDYVFENNYVLMNLSELEKFIQQKKHLPGIPSAKELEDAGGTINVSDIITRLLQKQEETILYLIELKKENEDLKKQITILKN